MWKGPLAIDPRGLIYEAYRMDLTPGDCRVIFLDWALGLAQPASRAEIQTLLDHYGPEHPDHPMTRVLRDGLTIETTRSTRRGGSRARRP